MQPTIPHLRPAAAITVTTTAESTVVAVIGEIDACCTGRLGDQLAIEVTLAPRALILDLSEVRFCSAQGLAVLLRTSTDAHASGVPCAVVTGRRAVLRPIRILRLDRVLQIHRTLADAQDWLAILPRLADVAHTFPPHHTGSPELPGH